MTGGKVENRAADLKRKWRCTEWDCPALETL